jgi:hypothetical protein
MSEDLIKREDAIKAVFQKPAIHGCDGSWYHADDIKDALESVSSADRPQGEWTNKHKWDNGFLERECSLCGAMKPILMHTAKINFCPNCGARMKGADDE